MSTLHFDLYRTKAPPVPAVLLSPENAEALISWGKLQQVVHVDPSGRGILYRIPAYSTRGGRVHFGDGIEQFSFYGFPREGDFFLIPWGTYVICGTNPDGFFGLRAYPREDFERVYEKIHTEAP